MSGVAAFSASLGPGLHRPSRIGAKDRGIDRLVGLSKPPWRRGGFDDVVFHRAPIASNYVHISTKLLAHSGGLRYHPSAIIHLSY